MPQSIHACAGTVTMVLTIVTLLLLFDYGADQQQAAAAGAGGARPCGALLRRRTFLRTTLVKLKASAISWSIVLEFFPDSTNTRVPRRPATPSRAHTPLKRVAHLIFERAAGRARVSDTRQLRDRAPQTGCPPGIRHYGFTALNTTLHATCECN